MFGEICHRLRPPHSLLPSRRGGPAHIDSDQSDSCSPLPPASKNARPFDDGDGASHRGRPTHVDGEQSEEYMAQRHLVTVQCPRTPPPPPPSPNRAHRTKPTMRCSHAPTPSSPGSSTVNSATTPASFTPSQPCASYTKSDMFSYLQLTQCSIARSHEHKECIYNWEVGLFTLGPPPTPPRSQSPPSSPCSLAPRRMSCHRPSSTCYRRLGHRHSTLLCACRSTLHVST